MDGDEWVFNEAGQRRGLSGEAQEQSNGKKRKGYLENHVVPFGARFVAIFSRQSSK